MIDQQSTIENIIVTVFAVIVIAISIGCIYAFVRAIFLFIFSQGKDEKVKAAWNSIRFMIIGIIFTVILLFIFPYIFKFMNLKGYENYNAKNIFNKSGELIKKAINLGNIVKKSQNAMEINGQFYYNDNPTPSVDSKPDYSNYSL